VNTIRFLPVWAAVLLAGCATTPPQVATYHDPGTGLRTDLITDNLVEPDQPSREMLWLNASRVFKTATRFSYYLEVTYAATAETGYLDISPGPSLVLVADGKELKFSGNGSQQLRRDKKGVLTENALYEVQAQDLRAIAAAQKVTVRVSGRNGWVQREFKAVNRERFREFVAKYAAHGP
jgi:hypothetical protein